MLTDSERLVEHGWHFKTGFDRFPAYDITRMLRASRWPFLDGNADQAPDTNRQPPFCLKMMSIYDLPISDRVRRRSVGSRSVHAK